MNEENIWENLELSDEKLKTAYDYLINQSDNFRTATKEVLSMEVEVSRMQSTDEAKRNMTLYSLIIVAPFLGSFRKKILHIAEFEDQGRFPVNIYCHIDNTLVKNIEENDILLEVKKILEKRGVINVIENLYRQSLEEKKKN